MESHIDNDHFSLARMNDLLSKCKMEDGQVSLDDYVHAFDELAK